MKLERIIELAKREAYAAGMPYRLGSVIYKSGRVLAVGNNWSGLHAEECAISRAWSANPSLLIGASILTVRLTALGRLANAKPCKYCIAAMLDCGIKKCWYSVHGELFSATSHCAFAAHDAMFMSQMSRKKMMELFNERPPSNVGKPTRARKHAISCYKSNYCGVGPKMENGLYFG